VHSAFIRQPYRKSIISSTGLTKNCQGSVVSDSAHGSTFTPPISAMHRPAPRTTAQRRISQPIRQLQQ
jgi:hypothetical protein